MGNIIYVHVLQFPTTRQLNAVYTKGSAQEVTLCHPDLVWLKSYKGVCNLTEENGGIPWYCGKPQNLTCDDWTSVEHAMMKDFPISRVENKLFKYVILLYKFNKM